jgi:hypothetical protein
MRRLSAKHLKLVLLAAIAGAALVVVPIGLSAKPVRTVTTPGPGVFPAGFGCAFDVGILPNGPNGAPRVTVTEFSDGRTVTVVNADPKLTNLDTGTSYVHRSTFTATDTYDPETNTILEVASGRSLLNLFPGDQGPFGEVGENGALFAMVGHSQLTFDLDTGQITSFSYVGTVTDVCPLLAA